MEEKEISQAVIGRLPRYYRYLGELKMSGVDRISSRELSKLMHVTASQIRQDLDSRGTDIMSVFSMRKSVKFSASTMTTI